MNQVLTAVLLTLVVAGALCALAFGFYRAVSTGQAVMVALRELSGGLRISDTTMKSLSDAAQKYQESAAAIEALPRLVQGFTEIAKSGVQEITRLERTVQALKASLVGGTNVSGPDVNEANMEYEIAQLMAERGIGRDAAEQHVREREMFGRMRF